MRRRGKGLEVEKEDSYLSKKIWLRHCLALNLEWLSFVCSFSHITENRVLSARKLMLYKVVTIVSSEDSNQPVSCIFPVVYLQPGPRICFALCSF